MKATATAYSNNALIKYWGRSNSSLRLPENNSISVNLSGLKTVTTVEFSKKIEKDDININDRSLRAVERVVSHINRIRKLAGIKLPVKVVSRNNFPSSTGLSSSASAFASLTLAGTNALGLRLEESRLSSLARLASGSACRSIPGGFTEWKKGNNHKNSLAYTIFPPEYFQIADIVAVLSYQKKKIPTSQAQNYARSSPFFQSRLKNLPGKIKNLKNAIQKKDFSQFGRLVEAEALELHSIILTSTPPVIYLLPETVSLINLVGQWRKKGLEVYFTLNTGHNLHLLCLKKDLTRLLKQLENVSFIKKLLVNFPAGASFINNNHLF